MSHLIETALVLAVHFVSASHREILDLVRQCFIQLDLCALKTDVSVVTRIAVNASWA